MIFITGATGFLGSYLAKNLIARGEKVRALKRSNSKFELLGAYAQKIEWVEGDILDVSSLEDAMDGVEKIYHCAGVISTTASGKENAAMVNAEGSANVFNVALDKKVKKVVHVSSTIALGLPLNNQLIDENYYATAEKLMGEYFKSKRYGELEAWRAYAEGLEVVIVNPAALIGGGYWNHEPLNAFAAVDQGLSFYPTGSNGFIDVRDAADIMVQLMESDISGERFILTSETIALKDFVCLIADEMKVKRPGIRLTKFLSGMAWRYEYLSAFLSGRSPSFTKEDIRTAQIPFRYDNSKIICVTGYQFKTVAQSVHETMQVFLESKKRGLDYGTFE